MAVLVSVALAAKCCAKLMLKVSVSFAAAASINAVLSAAVAWLPSVAGAASCKPVFRFDNADDCSIPDADR